MTASTTTASATRAMPRGRLLLPIFAMLVGFGPLTIDLVLPFLPTLQDDLGVSVATAQLVVTGATFGFAAGQLISGPLSDAVGRKWPLGVSAALHIAASLVAAMTSDTAVLLSARFVQGAACTAAGVVVTAIVRDLYEGRAAATMLSRASVVRAAMAAAARSAISARCASRSSIMAWRSAAADRDAARAAVRLLTDLVLRHRPPPDSPCPPDSPAPDPGLPASGGCSPA